MPNTREATKFDETKILGDEIEYPNADEKGLKDFYLAEFKTLRDELAAVTLSLNTDYRFAATSTAAIASFIAAAYKNNPAVPNLGAMFCIFLICGLWSKTLVQRGRQGVGLNYISHISQKLSGAAPLNKPPLSWMAALEDETFVKLPELTSRPVGRIYWLKNKSLNWVALLAIPIIYLCYNYWPATNYLKTYFAPGR